METKFNFKCCATKQFSYYFCVICNGVFHPSCLERDFKHHSKLEKHKILCAKECRNKFNENKDIQKKVLNVDNLQKENYQLKCQLKEREQEIENLEVENNSTTKALHQTIAELKKEIKEKDAQYERERKLSKDFANEMMESDNKNAEMEKKYIESLNKKREEIKKLKIDITGYLKEKSTLEQEKRTHLDKENKLEKYINDLRETNKNMIEAIRVLEDDNNRYSNELEEMRTEMLARNLTVQKKMVSKGTTTDNGPVIASQQCNFGVSETFVRQDHDKDNVRVLLLCDEYGYRLSKWLRDRVNLQAIVKPGGFYKNILEDIINLTKGFTLNDFVVIMGGSNDFSFNNNYPLFRDINSKLKHCTHTNIIVTSVPFQQSYEINNHINNFNTKLKDYSLKLNKYGQGCISWCEFENYKDKNNFKKLLQILLSSVNNCNGLYKNSKNLIFVPIVSNEVLNCEINSNLVSSNNDNFLDESLVVVETT